MTLWSRRAPTCLALATVVLLGAGCSNGEPEVALDSPEQTAESVGRILCAEHQARIAAIEDSLAHARDIQAAKARVVADGLAVSHVNERLETLASFFDTHEDALAACRVVLTDLVIVHTDSKVRVSLDVELADWHVDAAGKLDLAPRKLPVLLTLTLLDGAWKVTESSHDFALPGGALGGLLASP